jgi:protocatechuate 3,4-dioxygenase beta subunit
MQRRKFVGLGVSAFATLVFAKGARAQICKNKTEEDRYLDGPFHRLNAPNRIKLASEFEPGQRINIQGTVTNCAGPMADINLDVWHATDSGCYESFGGCPALPGHPELFRLRGQMRTNAEGKYSFETILPGAYLNGSKYRPRHIHIIITLPYTITTPILKETKTLITQLYFDGDPYILGDYAADHTSAANRIIALDKTVPTLWQGTWNIGIPDPKGTSDLELDHTMEQFDVYVRRAGNRMIFHLPSNSSKQPVETRIYDGLGTLVRRTLEAQAPIGLDMLVLNPGAYVVVFTWWTPNGLHKESIPIRI